MSFRGSMSVKEFVAMPSTGTCCLTSGIYEGHDACRARIYLDPGEPFPPCPRCGKAVDWSVVKVTS